MGRKTFESIGRPLPNRINIVLTNNNTYKADGIIVYTDINKLINDYKNDDIYVIGGKQIYDAFSKYADTYIISFIHNSYDCDTFAPQIDNNFKLVSEDNSHPEFTIKTFKK
jgi:dihydrofolate reductase